MEGDDHRQYSGFVWVRSTFLANDVNIVRQKDLIDALSTDHAVLDYELQL